MRQYIVLMHERIKRHVASPARYWRCSLLKEAPCTRTIDEAAKRKERFHAGLSKIVVRHTNSSGLVEDVKAALPKEGPSKSDWTSGSEDLDGWWPYQKSLLSPRRRSFGNSSSLGSTANCLCLFVWSASHKEAIPPRCRNFNYIFCYKVGVGEINTYFLGIISVCWPKNKKSYLIKL